MTNYDLIPKKEINEGDHHSAEYFEADDEDADIIKIEDDSGEEDVASTSNSDGGTGRRRISKRLRLRSKRQHVLNIFLNIELQVAPGSADGGCGHSCQDCRPYPEEKSL